MTDNTQQARAASIPDAAIEAAAAKAAITDLILQHWVQEWLHPLYPTSVKCMAPDCEWEGRFPGDIAQHNADLIMSFLEGQQLEA